MIVVMPMAGKGSRYSNKGYNIPKPLIEVKGKPMFAWALQSLDDVTYSQLIVVALKEYEKDYMLSNLLDKYCKKSYKLLLLDSVTEGQLCTVLAAKPFFDNEKDILIISSDTLVISSIGREIEICNKDCKGLISVINMPGESWSFAKVDEIGRVIEVAEKVRISEFASTGLYYFSNIAEFVKMSEDMINKEEKTRGEYYVIPVYQKLIEQGDFVGISVATKMWDMGTPEAKKNFEENT